MKKYLLTVIMMIACGSLFAQEINTDELTQTADSVANEDTDSRFYPVDYDALEEWVKNNPKAYNSLMKHFRAADSLHIEDLYILYYGYSFTKDYNPLYHERDASLEAFNAGEAEKAYKLYKKDFKDNPVYLRTVYRLYLLANYLGYEEEAKKYYLQYIMLGAALAQTGNGNEKYPVHVINVSDEYEFIEQFFGSYERKSQTLHGMCDKHEVKLKEFDSELTLWFDCTRHFQAMEELFGEGK